jgi:hypothetical protein
MTPEEHLVKSDQLDEQGHWDHAIWHRLVALPGPFAVDIRLPSGAWVAAHRGMLCLQVGDGRGACCTGRPGLPGLPWYWVGVRWVGPVELPAWARAALEEAAALAVGKVLAGPTRGVRRRGRPSRRHGPCQLELTGAAAGGRLPGRLVRQPPVEDAA